jgi:hypothetical protein
VISIAAETLVATLAMSVAMSVVPATAQQSGADIPGVTIDTKISPKRTLLIFSTYGYDSEGDFHIDGQLPEFSSFFVQCEPNRTDDKDRSGSVWQKIARPEFKPDSDGGWFARRDAMLFPATHSQA